LSRDHLRAAAALAVMVSLSLALSGCGRKGALDPPPGAEPASPAPGAPTRYIDPTTPIGGPQQAAAPATAAAPQRPKKTFILDPLLQ
jgi:predicted small lipoprotein YifL